MFFSFSKSIPIFFGVCFSKPTRQSSVGSDSCSRRNSAPKTVQFKEELVESVIEIERKGLEPLPDVRSKAITVCSCDSSDVLSNL